MHAALCEAQVGRTLKKVEAGAFGCRTTAEEGMGQGHGDKIQCSLFVLNLNSQKATRKVGLNLIETCLQ
jgi:hypothetical protein